MPLTVWGLALAQALLASGNILLVALSALIGKQLATNDFLITFPMAAQFLGLIMATLPSAHLMQKLGRKIGFIIGNMIGLFGTYVALQGLEESSLWLFSVGTWLIGMAIGVGQQYRFAALDLCTVAQRPRAISIVMAGGVVAAIFGSNLAVWTQKWSVTPFVGSFYGLAILYVIALLLIIFLPLPKAKGRKVKEQVRSYKELFQQPLLVVAVASGAIGYAIMVLLMTATPLAMEANGFAFKKVAMVIQWHVLGMFVPSFFTGRLIERFGTRRVIVWGCMLLIISAVINITGVSYTHFMTGLILLGVGWNFTFIGATNLLSFTYQSAEQGKVQGINEFIIFSASAVGSLFSGQGVVFLGWSLLNAVSIPFVVAITILIWRTRIEQPSGTLLKRA